MLHVLNSILNFPVHYIQSLHLNNVLTLAVALGWLCMLAIFAFFILLGVVIVLRSIAPIFAVLLREFGVGKQAPPDVFLELRIPATTAKSAYAMERLHTLFRNRAAYQDFFSGLAGHKKRYSLELVGTNDEGIRYITAVQANEAAHVTRNLLSFLPAMKIVQVSDYMATLKKNKVGMVELKQWADFVLPLADHKALEEHDPMAFITNHMTKLKPGELVALQIVTTPVTRATHYQALRHVRKVQAAIARNHSLSEVVTHRRGVPHVLWLILLPPVWLLVMAIKFVASIPVAIMDPGSPDIPILQGGTRKRRVATNPYDLELAQSVKPKLDQQLFEIAIRVLVVSPDTETIHGRLDGITSALRMFDSPYQLLISRRVIPFSKRLQRWQADRSLARFRERELAPNLLSYGTIVSSSELSDLYHFANTNTTKTEGLATSRSKELPTPQSLKRTDTKLDVVVGTNKHGGAEQPVGQTLEQRQKHTYVIGKTGTGKTTLLTSAIRQDMESGKGLAVIDPHGDMFRELLTIVPEHRKKDVVIFDPSDRQYPVGLNILKPGIRFESEEDAHEWTTSMVLSVFAKLADESFWGPRMEHILRSVTLTALTTDNPNLYTIQRLLTDKKYQRTVAKSLDDPILKQFWTKEVAAYGDMQFANMVAPLTHRLGHFITTKMSRHILLQPASTISISDIMDEGKILLANLSKGDIGEDQSFFFGTLLTSLMWVAAYQRTKIPEKRRRDFFLYIDEFQNFATPQFTDITSEGRKFHIALTVSHQNVAQIKDQSVLKIMAGNAHSIICLKASPDDEAFILPFMQPEVERGDIVNLAPHHFFMKTTADESEAAFSGTVIPLGVEQSDKVKNVVVAYSRKHYATPRATVENYLKELLDDV